MTKKYKFSITRKIVLGIFFLSMITYGTSAFFLIVLKDNLTSFTGVSTNSFIIGTMSLGGIWSVILGFIAARILTKPIVELEESTRKASTGDLQNDVNVSKSDDELRALGLAFNQMLANMRVIVKDINNNFEVTNSSVEELTLASEQAASAVESISITIDEIAKGAERQASASSSTENLVTDVNDLSEEVKAKANLTKNFSYRMKTDITNSIDVVHELIGGLNGIAQTNQKSIELVGRLEKNAEEIGSITKLVGDIAEQTKLLALNASIEAAQAGEHGAGFSVVANEVRKLSGESAEAVKNIGSLIGQMQQEVHNVVEQISNQVEMVNKESIRGNSTKESLSNVIVSVEEVVDSIDDINEILEKQVLLIQGTMDEAKNVAVIAEETLAGSEEVASAMQEQTAFMEEIASKTQYLKEASYQLKTTITKFQI